MSQSQLQDESSFLLHLSESQKKYLLSIARQSIQKFLSEKVLVKIENSDTELNRKQGAFVTLFKKKKLRGCIGHISDDLPLYEVVGLMALQAAIGDNRFEPVTLKELSEIEIEVSILSPFKQISNIDEILIGRDGVLLRKGELKGVFLPQVPVRMKWNHTQLLDHLCTKVGLPSDSWKKDTRLFTFQTEVFFEKDFK